MSDQFNASLLGRKKQFILNFWTAVYASLLLVNAVFSLSLALTVLKWSDSVMVYFHQ